MIARLPVELTPHPDESAGGFMLRTLAANGANPRELLAMVRGSVRRQLATADAALFRDLTGVEHLWFEQRIPQDRRGDRWMEVKLFGSRWRDDWTLRGQHGQVCPACLLEFGYARLAWDLTAFVACPIHGRLLLDRCDACGRALQPHRPAVDVCRCGSFIEASGSGENAVGAEILGWCQWLTESLKCALSDSPTPPAPNRLLHGLSLDGAYRLVIALGGGTRELRGASMNSVCWWLSTEAVSQALGAGLDVLRQLEAGRVASPQRGLGCGDALAEQSLRGVTLADRHAAAGWLAKLKLPSRWRNRQPVIHQQGDLFDGWP